MITQVRGFVPLWGRHTAYYQNYYECLGDCGLEDKVINPALWSRSRAPASYTGNVVTSYGFERNITSHLLTAFRYALRLFLVNYSLVALEEARAPTIPLSYFVMIAPGRVVTIRTSQVCLRRDVERSRAS